MHQKSNRCIKSRCINGIIKSDASTASKVMHQRHRIASKVMHQRRMATACIKSDASTAAGRADKAAGQIKWHQKSINGRSRCITACMTVDALQHP
jgi:hypothetical protein